MGYLCMSSSRACLSWLPRHSASKRRLNNQVLQHCCLVFGLALYQAELILVHCCLLLVHGSLLYQHLCQYLHWLYWFFGTTVTTRTWDVYNITITVIIYFNFFSIDCLWRFPAAGFPAQLSSAVPVTSYLPAGPTSSF